MKQFSIRDLLFVVVIVALVLGWWLERRPVPARYQLQMTNGHACVLDTATGQVWEKGFESGYTSSDFLDPKANK